jgi:hypothetical protein
MTLRECQGQLFGIWIIGSTPTFLLLFTRSLGSWRGDVVDVWGWFATVLGPTLSFVIAAYIAGVKNQSVTTRVADRALFQAARVGSILYLLLIVGVLVAANRAPPALAFMHDAEPGLGAAQAVVCALLGYFHLAAK